MTLSAPRPARISRLAAAAAIALTPSLALGQVSGGPIGAGVSAPPIGAMTAAGMGNRPRPRAATARRPGRVTLVLGGGTRRARAVVSGRAGNWAP